MPSLVQSPACWIAPADKATRAAQTRVECALYRSPQRRSTAALTSSAATPIENKSKGLKPKRFFFVGLYVGHAIKIVILSNKIN
jgi:hypothetical protein